jgi:hypothetical protein
MTVAEIQAEQIRVRPPIERSAFAAWTVADAASEQIKVTAAASVLVEPPANRSARDPEGSGYVGVRGPRAEHLESCGANFE